MAKNYTIGEVAAIINAGNDIESVMDIGRRFPVLSVFMTKVVCKSTDPDTLVAFFNAFPEYVNANKINKALKDNLVGEVGESTDDTDDDAEDEVKEEAKPAKKAAKKEEPVADDDEDDEDDEYAGKSATDLYKMCKKAGIKVPTKKDADFYIAKLKEAANAEDEADEDDEPVEEAPKKAAKKAPAKKAAEEDEDDDWDI